MRDNNSILYVQTGDRPERQYPPFVLAQTARAMNIKPVIYFLGTGLKVLAPGEAKKIKIETFPSLMDMIENTLAMEIEIYACEASKKMLGWDRIELIPGIQVVGAGTLNDLALESGATMWF